jgi:hypothetical protein
LNHNSSKILKHLQTKLHSQQSLLHRMLTRKYRCLVWHALGHLKKVGRKIKGFSVANAVKGVQTKFDTRRKAVGVILIFKKIKRQQSLKQQAERMQTS